MPEIPAVHLPRTSARTSAGYVKLLSGVSPSRVWDWEFQGKVFRPGSAVTAADLKPGPEYPEEPVVLEFAGRLRGRREGATWILWRQSGGEWREVARAIAEGREWVHALAEPAKRAIARERPPEEGLQAGRRVLAAMQAELDRLGAAERREMLGTLYDQVTARVCEEGALGAV